MAPPVRWVDEWALREVFNLHVWPRIQRGELREVVKSSGSPGPDSPEPAGTRSEIVAYHEVGGSTVALAHRYVRPDGSYGGSGLRRPDPKWVVHEGCRYHLQRP